MSVELTVAEADLLAALVAGHLLGDFVFQTGRMVRAKAEWRVALAHAGIVSGITWILVGHFEVLWIPLAILVTHFLIDWCKARCGALLQQISGSDTDGGFPGQNGALLLFIADQAAHLLVLGAILWAAGGDSSVSGESFWRLAVADLPTQAFVVVSGWVVAALAAGHVLGLYLERFERQLTEDQKDGLRNGGYWIGVTERSLIFLFILAGEPAGIGFLAAAKSVFRIGELRKSEDRKLAEYILIGTLMSFTIAMIVGLLTRRIMDAL